MPVRESAQEVSYRERMQIRFYLDPISGEPHIWRHGVTETEVRQALLARSEDRPGADGSRVGIGRTEGGWYVRVIYVREQVRGSILVLTAYELSGQALWAFRRRRRRTR